MGFEKTRKVWISWEDHRRSRELAEAFGVEYFPICNSKGRVLRYLFLSFRTFWTLFTLKPKLLFVQNPSIVLAALACVLKPLLKYQLVVDRHSNFKEAKSSSKKLVWKVFHFLSDFSLRKADLTIVTNEYFSHFVEEKGGRAAVLQDRLPALAGQKCDKTVNEKRVVCVTTFSDDEPIFELVEAARILEEPYRLYFTGSYKNYAELKALESIAPSNVVLTGFLSEIDYQNLLASADVIVVLTSEENLLTCGAYEAVSLEKPMVLSKTETITSYFYKGASYVDNSAEDLAKAIKMTVDNEGLQEEVSQLKVELIEQWKKPFSEIKMALDL